MSQTRYNVYPPPSIDFSTNAKNDSKILPKELDTIIDNNLPSKDVINQITGEVNKERLKEACMLVFTKDMAFYNFYQAKEFSRKFCSPWGMSIATEGNRIFCTFGKPRKKAYKSLVPEDRRRDMKTSLKLLGCPW